MKIINRAVLVAALALPLVGSAEEVTNITWKSSVSLGATYKAGNTDKTLYTVNLKGDRFASKSDWLSSLYGEYGETEGEQTEGQLRAQSNYRYKFGSEDFYGGIFAEGYHDALKDINYRVKLGPNVGYYFINNDVRKFDASLGLNAVYESNSEENTDGAEWRLAANYLWDMSETASLYANAEYSASVDDYEDGLGLFVIGTKSKMSEKLSLFAELRQEYDNMLPDNSDTEHTDTTVVVGLTYDLM
jgi:hypothetical protein